MYLNKKRRNSFVDCFNNGRKASNAAFEEINEAKRLLRDFRKGYLNTTDNINEYMRLRRLGKKYNLQYKIRKGR